MKWKKWKRKKTINETKVKKRERGVKLRQRKESQEGRERETASKEGTLMGIENIDQEKKLSIKKYTDGIEEDILKV